jgi:hypothetical protein
LETPAPAQVPDASPSEPVKAPMDS